MRVLYDASVLGIGHGLPTARTGVFRVTENLANRLAASEECDLVLYSGLQEFETGLRDYLKTNPRLRGVPLHVPPISKLTLAVNRSRDLVSNVSLGSSRPGQFSVRAMRRLFGYGAKIVDTLSEKIDRDLAGADIFHSTYFPFPEAIKRAPRVKRFLTIYDLIPILHPQFFESNTSAKTLVEKALGDLDRDDYVLCISQATKDDLCNHKRDIDRSKVFVTHLAASDLFRPRSDMEEIALLRKRHGIPPGAPYLLSLGTLEPRKNIDQIIRCFAKVIQEQRIPDLYLVLVGTRGWQYTKIFEAVSEYVSSKNRIIFTGYIADEELAPLYSGALAFIYLSLYEGFGLPPLEAMQCGTPVISSNTSSLPEVVGDAAILVDPNATDEICQSILEVYRDDELRGRMSQKSLERASHFSWEKCTRETISSYQTALQQ